jgi:periplasmic protein CpxP/Spy
MTDQTNSVPPNGAASNAQPSRKRGRRWFLLTAGALAAALGGAAASHALSDGPPWHRGGFMGGMGGMGGMHHMGVPFDPARAADRIDRMIRHLAIEIDATTEQQEKLRAIAKAAVSDLAPMREKAQSARERARSLLTQPNVDRAAIEAFRAEQIALADEASRRFARALGDVAEVLTPEQRRKIDDHVGQRRGYWHGRHRG